MTPETTIDDTSSTNRYRLPGIEREGIAQLSLLETALWPLQFGAIRTPRFETTYTYMTASGPQTANVTVRSANGLKSIDEYILWGLLGSTVNRPNADSVLLAPPYWMLKELGIGVGGSQYAELRDSLLRLSTTSYQNTGFYNPETRAREWVALQFLSILLPTVGDIGGTVDNDRCWRIEWNPAFFRFCRATGGTLLFDLDLYRNLSPASRRLFLKLKDRFWRDNRVFLNVDDLTINGLGFSADRPLKKRKYDLTQCIGELLAHRVIELGRGQTDPRDLFLRRGKGSYVVVFYRGEYFRQSLAGRTQRQKNAISEDALYKPLQKIGVDEPGIRRLFRDFSRNAIQRWIRITDAAMHEKPRGFTGFKTSPAAFLIDGLQHNRMPPDWMHAHEKHREKRQWEAEHSAFTAHEQSRRHQYEQERATALQEFIKSQTGRQCYEPIFKTLLELYRQLEPHRSYEAAHEATIARIERDHFEFPSYSVWALTGDETEVCV